MLSSPQCFSLAEQLHPHSTARGSRGLPISLGARSFRHRAGATAATTSCLHHLPTAISSKNLQREDCTFMPGRTNPMKDFFVGKNAHLLLNTFMLQLTGLESTIRFVFGATIALVNHRTDETTSFCSMFDQPAVGR